MESNRPSQNGPIRITTEEANSGRVDDLLKRQASLRGDQGISRSRNKAWYYSNWFIFAVAGAIGAFAAAVIIEPYLDDLIYLRGTVTEIGPAQNTPFVPIGLGQLELNHGVTALATVTVNNETIWLLSMTQHINSDGDVADLEIADLKVGDEIGLHLEAEKLQDGQYYALAAFVEESPTRSGVEGYSIVQLLARNTAASLLLFPLVAAFVGFSIGAADGMVCRLWRRVLLGGIVGLLIGFIGGFISQMLAGLVYLPLNQLANDQQDGIGSYTTLGFLAQVTGRSLAWCLAGMAMGLGQGVALRSSRLLLYGFLGGAIGGLVGGMVFDPLDLALGLEKTSAHVSRLIGLGIIGTTVGLMIGIVELLARDAWLRMLQGPLSGKEFLIFKDLVNLGASPRSDIYLFNDDQVNERHAVIRAAADQYEIEALASELYPTLVNDRPVTRTRLRHGDQIRLGSTVFVFQRRRVDQN
jgi:hypothetical protein